MRSIVIGPALLAMSVAAAGLAFGTEVALDKVPAPVMETIKTRFPELKVVEAATEKDEAGKLIYEISLDNKGLNIDATFSPDGPMTLMEKEITRTDLPPVVATALEQKFPKARYRTVEEVYEVKDKQEKLVRYEAVLITPQKQIRGVEIGVDGKILLVEKRTTEEED